MYYNTAFHAGKPPTWGEEFSAPAGGFAIESGGFTRTPRPPPLAFGGGRGEGRGWGEGPSRRIDSFAVFH